MQGPRFGGAFCVYWPRMGWINGYGECPLAAGERKGCCTWCGASLTGRRRRWCSDECAVDGYLGNHRFAQARWTAIRRAMVYRIIPDPIDPDAGMILDPRRKYGRIICAHCGEEFGDGGVQVDHIEAANGAHAKLSCIHHQDNLRVLCEPCHKRRTAQQARERAAARKGQRLLFTRMAATWHTVRHEIRTADNPV